MLPSKAQRRILAGIAALAFVATGCNSRLIRPPAIVFADGGEYTISTALDNEEYGFPSVFLSFVPSRVPLHPGDALNFEVRETGEPHTVALGRLIDSAVTALGELGPTASLAKVERLAEMRRIPAVFPGEVRGKVPSVNRSATERCFLDKGRPPNRVRGAAPPCEEREQPEFDGKQSFYSSGLLEDGEPFRVKLSSDIEPGEYRFMCLMHRSAMSGTIEVRDPDVERPTVAELREEATREEEQIESAIRPSASNAIRRKGGAVLAGTGPRGTARGFISAFIPKDLKIEAGKTATWTFYRMHSISFEASRDAQEGLFLEEDPPRINPDAWEPVESRRPPRDVFDYPSASKSYVIDGGRWSGEGTFSSGVIRATPPARVSYRLVFEKAGKYAYSCLVHPGMRGTVEVT